MSMDFKTMAKQLAHPSGDLGIEVGNGMNVMNAFINQQTYGLLSLQDGESVLEIGLGNGEFINEIIQHKPKLLFTGVDLSETMINEAKKRNRTAIASGQVDLMVGALEDLPFWDETFDKVCTINTIYFWKAPTQALNEIKRVLKPNGRFVLAMRPFIKGQSLDFTNYGFNEFSPDVVDELLTNHQFKIIDQKIIEEPEVEFNGQMHALKSAYWIAQKKE